jgi:repressor LexA
MLTPRQAEVLRCLEAYLCAHGVPPSTRELQRQLGLSSQTTVVEHLAALVRKGVLRRLSGKARGWMPADYDPAVLRGEGRAAGRRAEVGRAEGERGPGVAALASASLAGLRRIPIFGTIPAGLPQDEAPAPEEHIELDPALLRSGPREPVYGLRVRGDSMIGAHICDGDLAFIAPQPGRAGQIVAALIDGASTLKRLVVADDGRAYLKAENPAYPPLLPAWELVVQGVLVGLYRPV